MKEGLQTSKPSIFSVPCVTFFCLKESDRLTDKDIFKFLTNFRKPPALAKKSNMIPSNSAISFKIKTIFRLKKGGIRFEFHQTHSHDTVDCCLGRRLNRL